MTSKLIKVKKAKKNAGHRCEVPARPHNLEEGSKVKCDVCRRVWYLSGKGINHWYVTFPSYILRTGEVPTPIEVPMSEIQ